MQRATAVLLVACLLTGCEDDGKSFFGSTGTYLFKIGEDMFGTGHSGVFGGESETEPQSNEVAEIFQDYNVKDVEKAPKTEKAVYDFNGPKNDGIPETGSSDVLNIDASANDSSQILGGNSGSTSGSSGPVVVLSSGHTMKAQEAVDVLHPNCYGVLAVDLVMMFRTDKNVDEKEFGISYNGKKKVSFSWSIGDDLHSYDKTMSEFAKEICGTTGKVGRKDIIKRLIGLKIIKPVSGMTGDAVYEKGQLFQFTFQKKKKLDYAAYYKKGHKIFEKCLIDPANKEMETSGLSGWLRASLVMTDNVNPSLRWSGGVLAATKIQAIEGAYFDSFSEYEINWQITNLLAKELEKDGYTVKIARADKNGNTLVDGSSFGDKNMTMWANSVAGAVVNLHLHWDATQNSLTAGMRLYTGKYDLVNGDAVSRSEKISDAMKAKGDKGVEIFKNATAKNTTKKDVVDNLYKESKGFTALNWQSIPTVIVECGYLRDGDFGKYVVEDNDGNKAFMAKKWLEGRYDVFKAGVKEAVKSSTSSTATSTGSAPSNGSTSSNASTKNIIIGIDPGHQTKGDSDTEFVGPGAEEKKAKVAGGATGTSTHAPEYELNLEISKKVKAELENRGYQVVMTRNKNDVNISNKERAALINKSGADICVRIHADSDSSPSTVGASTLYPSKSNPYVSDLSKKSKKLAESVIDSYTKATGLKDRGVKPRDDLTGLNWSTVPVIVLEMGFMSNPKEDKKMQKKKFQEKMVKGICDGIDNYYK